MAPIAELTPPMAASLMAALVWPFFSATSPATRALANRATWRGPSVGPDAEEDDGQAEHHHEPAIKGMSASVRLGGRGAPGCCSSPTGSVTRPSPLSCRRQRSAPGGSPPAPVTVRGHRRRPGRRRAARRSRSATTAAITQRRTVFSDMAAASYALAPARWRRTSLMISSTRMRPAASSRHTSHWPPVSGGRVEDPVQDVELGGQDDRDDRAAVERELTPVRHDVPGEDRPGLAAGAQARRATFISENTVTAMVVATSGVGPVLERVADPERRDRHEHAEPDGSHPLRHVEHRLGERAGLAVHEAGQRLVEPQGDGDRHLHHEVDPEHRQRRERDAVGDREDRRAEEGGDEARPGRPSGSGCTSTGCRRARGRTRRPARSWRSCRR